MTLTRATADYASIFGAPDDPIELVASRAAFVDAPVVWEGDASTFRFTYVSPNVERVLGHAPERWLTEPTFWADVVIHPDDREDAVAYCALATCKKADHTFEYRAVRADGAVVWLLDVVRVVLGRRGVPERLRGLMFDLTATRIARGDLVRIGELPADPARADLERLAG